MEHMYTRFLVVLAINTLAMFALTYVMVDTPAHIYLNVNRLYMALIMMAPMGLLMLAIMRHMYPNRRLNLLLYAVFAALLVGTFLLIRSQTPVGDAQFLRSMIPHHSGAILMCERAALTDAEIRQLCTKIVESQKEEIGQMEAIFARLRGAR